jgi:hypothetical protein
MPGRHQQGPPRRLGLRWLAGVLSVGVVATAGAAIMATAGAAGAAATPNPSYHPGADPATFAVTGVLDGNCQVSIGGTEVWIKPGDKINFNSSLVGVNLPVVTSLVTGLVGKVVGLNVTAVVDAGTSHAQTVAVSGGRTTVFANAANLSGGNHTLTWTATSVAVLPLLGSLINVPLSSSALHSGTALKWQGVIHVTNDTANCKLSVSTPKVGISVGPIKVTVPPINVRVPAPTLPNLPTLTLPGGHPSTPASGSTTPPAGGGVHYTPPPLTVPEQAMSRVGNGAVGGEGVLPNGGAPTQIRSNVPQAPVPTNDPSPTDAAGASKRMLKTILASNRAPAAQLPVLLAIIAIIALSLVTATYARLYMLRRDI